MTYDDAIRMALRHRCSADMRLPAMADVRSAFTSSQLAELVLGRTMPFVVIRIPKVGDLSRKERDEIRTLMPPKSTAKVFDDFKRLEKGFPEAIASIRKTVNYEEGDLLVLVGEPKADTLNAAAAQEAG